MNSNLFSVNWKDVLNGLVVAILTAVVGAISTGLNTLGLSFFTQFNWQGLLIIALTSGLGYLSKKFLSTPDGKFGGVL